MMNLRKSIYLLLAVLTLGCASEDKDYENVFNDPLLYSRTVKQLNNVVLENNFPPMIASRNYAYASIAAYETMAIADERFQTLAGQIEHLPRLPQLDTANVNFHYASLLAFCKVGEAVTFPEGSMQNYVNDLDSMAKKVRMPRKVILASKELADSVSNHILRWSKDDNYAKTRSAPRYTVTSEAGRWIPTPPMYAQAVEPYWCEIRPMVIDSAGQFTPPPPPPFDTLNKNSTYFRGLMEVKQISDSLTAEQKHIADFWDDNPFTMHVQGHVMFATKKFSPPGHWMNIVGIGAKEAKADFTTTVAAYAHTSIALFDAFISCWKEKYRSNYIRPETVLNKYFPEWRPHLQTPPFPSYTSGHATNSAAAAEVMTKWFGDNLSFTDTSLLEFGIANRQIKSFRDAAKEAALSRLYGGIHYRFDNDKGNEAGTLLGQYIVDQLKFRKKQISQN